MFLICIFVTYLKSAEMTFQGSFSLKFLWQFLVSHVLIDNAHLNIKPNTLKKTAKSLRSLPTSVQLPPQVYGSYPA